MAKNRQYSDEDKAAALAPWPQFACGPPEFSIGLRGLTPHLTNWKAGSVGTTSETPSDYPSII
jgi:hypothetical protein